MARKERSDKETGELSPEVAKLEEYFQIMESEDLHELEVKDGRSQVKLVKRPPYAVSMPLSHQFPVAGKSTVDKAAQKPDVDPGLQIKSPLAGVFYRARSPQSPPFVKEGDVITPEKVMCIVEAMKVMNEIVAGMSGKVVKILVENGKPVEANQPLFVVETT